MFLYMRLLRVENVLNMLSNLPAVKRAAEGLEGRIGKLVAS